MKAKAQLLLWASLIALVVLSLKFLEYQLWIRSLRLEVYLGLVALIFMGLGLWAGITWNRGRRQRKIPVFSDEYLAARRRQLGISPREFEVLELIAAGHSNQEIADACFVSLSTVKSHVSRLFSKLDVQRRTQAVQKARELQLLPPAAPDLP